jgi:hypothetical protein
MKIHFNTEQYRENFPFERYSLCQRLILMDHLTRDPGAVTCRQCQRRINDRNVYWQECRPKQQEILDRLISEGWTPATEPPDTDRIVQVAWEDDGSTGPTSLAFYDSEAITPPQPEKFWWSHPGMTKYSDGGGIIAWREVEKKEGLP